MSKKRMAMVLFFIVMIFLVIFGIHYIQTTDPGNPADHNTSVDNDQNNNKNQNDNKNNDDKKNDGDKQMKTAAGVPRIHVKNCRIADEDGNTVQLTGMSSHGLLWFPQYTNADAMKTLQSYGANTFRIAVYSNDVDGGYVQNKEETRSLVHTAIDNAINTDLYVIVDWHVLRDGNPLFNEDSAAEFFEAVSSSYGDSPNILYEICNEPNGSTSWNDIYDYANRIIPVIRKNAPHAIIITGTPDFSYSIESVFDQPLDFENVMYSFHFYAGQFEDTYDEIFDQCESHHIPVFVSEWGINYRIDGTPALSQAEDFVAVLNERKISWTAWSLCNKDEVFSAIQPLCEKLSDWTLDDLTDVGKVFFQSFR